MAEDMEKALRLVQEGYDAFNRGDYDAAAENLHPDVQFHRVAEVETALEGRGAVRDNMTPDVWRISDGKAAEFRFFLDRDEAVAAASAG